MNSMKEVKEESGKIRYSAKITVTNFTKEGDGELGDNNGIVIRNGQLQLEK